MKKVEEKQKTIKDLEELYNKYVVNATDESKEEWKNEVDFVKLLVCAYRDTKHCSSFRKVITDKLIVDDIWRKDVDAFEYGLRHYNIKEFVFKDTSTQAMEILIRFLELGWEVVGTEDWGIEESFDYKGMTATRFYKPCTGIVIRKKKVEK